MTVITRKSTVMAIRMTKFSVLLSWLVFMFQASKTFAAAAWTFGQDSKRASFSATNDIESKHQQSNFFDAIALSFGSTSEPKKKGTRKNMRIETKNAFRKLDQGHDLLETRTFPECIEQSLSPEECQALIQQQIEDAGGHEVGEVNVKIQTPRTPEEFAESYWMVEVPVNLYAKMTCDRNDGKTFYPLKWTDDETGNPLDVEDQDCLGLSAGECCLKIRNYGKQLTMSGYDNNKQCLSCFVHQEPMEPVYNNITGETDYLECKDTENDICVQEQLTGIEVDALDLQTVGRIEAAINSLESFQSDRSCDTIDQVLEDLYNAASVIYPLSIKIGRLACNVCYGEHDLDLDDNFVTFQLDEILMMLKEYSPPAKSIDSKENCIIIYTNTDREVVKDPTLGGNRSDMRSTGKETVSRVVPVPAPVIPPVEEDDDDSYGSFDCKDDSDCGRTEWCDRYGDCNENLCITRSPCSDEHERCEPTLDWKGYRCLNCDLDPSICDGENEYCILDIKYHYDDDYQSYDGHRYPYECHVYKNPGENCGRNTFYGFQGDCNPNSSFCLARNECKLPDGYRPESPECIAYGEGSCRDETTGQKTQANCKSDEYCDHENERCKPNRNLGDCCNPELNNCGYGSEEGTLICAPGREYLNYNKDVINFHTCQKVCNTDNDCGTNEWCAIIDEQTSRPNYPAGKFCKEYKSVLEFCHPKLPGSIGLGLHTEERCDPSNAYCYDALCIDESYGVRTSECRSYGNKCTNDSDCANDKKISEWCDVDIGYCKKRAYEFECCTTLDDEHKNDCPPGYTCQPGSLIDWYSPGVCLPPGYY